MKPKYYIYPNRKPENGEEVIIREFGRENKLKYNKKLDDNRIGNYASPVTAYYSNWLWRYA